MQEVARYALLGRFLGEREDFDIIHVHDWMTYQAGIQARRASGKPLVAHIHATEFDRSGKNVNTQIYEIEREGLQSADRVLAVSHRTKQMVVEKYGVAEEKVRVVHNAVEKDDICQDTTTAGKSNNNNFEGEKIVTFLGRITMQKGPEFFILAAQKVLKELKNVHFVMAGSGDMASSMIEEMASLGLVERFHFTGFLAAEEREKLFAMSDLYVMPSVSEPFGITPLEAMKHGIPVIISKQSGIGEILDHVTKVDFWDVDKLASSIIDILTKPEFQRDMKEKNLQLLEKISWNKPAKETLEIYQSLLIP